MSGPLKRISQKTVYPEERTMILTMVIVRSVIYCGWPGASVIDSSTWVVGGSDSSVAVETNMPRQPANRSGARASGIHLTHAKDFFRTKAHIKT